MGAEFNLSVADADQYRITLSGFPISRGAGQSGYSDGEYFTATQTKKSFVIVEGTDGTVARSKTNSRIIEMSIILLQVSASNDFLSQLLAADENAPNGAGIGSFVLQDMQGTTLIKCSRTWIEGPADVSLDRGAKERKWPLHGIKSIYNIGSN
jgi:hypothetical protein